MTAAGEGRLIQIQAEQFAKLEQPVQRLDRHVDVFIDESVISIGGQLGNQPGEGLPLVALLGEPILRQLRGLGIPRISGPIIDDQVEQPRRVGEVAGKISVMRRRIQAKRSCHHGSCLQSSRAAAFSNLRKAARFRAVPCASVHGFLRGVRQILERSLR